MREKTDVVPGEAIDEQRVGTSSRRRVLRTGAAIAGTVTMGSLAGCAGALVGQTHVYYPLDRDDPRVQAAREAERRAYDYYGLELDEHFVDVDALDLQIRVVEVGSGPPVVVIAGGVGYGVRWVPLLAELSGFTAYVVDRPGGGLSDGIDHQALPLPTIAEASTTAVYDHFRLGRAPIVANSMGGYWSIQFSIVHPDRPSALALLGCPALYPGEVTPLPARLMNLPFVGGFLVDEVLRPGSVDDVREGMSFQGHPEETANRLPDELVEAVYRMERLPHFTRSWVTLLRSATNLVGVPDVALTPDDLRAVRPQVLLGWGSDDSFGSPDVGRAGARHFPDAEAMKWASVTYHGSTSRSAVVRSCATSSQGTGDPGVKSGWDRSTRNFKAHFSGEEVVLSVDTTARGRHIRAEPGGG